MAGWEGKRKIARVERREKGEGKGKKMIEGERVKESAKGAGREREAKCCDGAQQREVPRPPSPSTF